MLAYYATYTKMKMLDLHTPTDPHAHAEARLKAAAVPTCFSASGVAPSVVVPSGVAPSGVCLVVWCPVVWCPVVYCIAGQ